MFDFRNVLFCDAEMFFLARGTALQHPALKYFIDMSNFLIVFCIFFCDMTVCGGLFRDLNSYACCSDLRLCCAEYSFVSLNLDHL